MDALLQKDEEIDSSVYAAYLRAQCDIDLLDIVQHLDPERYPARLDAARREIRRRHVTPVTVHGPEERFMRGLAVIAFALSAEVVLLTLMLTPDDLLLLQLPDVAQLPPGTMTSTVMYQIVVHFLRVSFTSCQFLGIDPLVLITFLGWLLIRARHPALRADVKWIVAATTVTLFGAVAMAAAPFSSVPAISSNPATNGGFWLRFMEILFPW